MRLPILNTFFVFFSSWPLKTDLTVPTKISLYIIDTWLIRVFAGSDAIMLVSKGATPLLLIQPYYSYSQTCFKQPFIEEDKNRFSRQVIA